MRRTVPLAWTVGHTADPRDAPTRRVPARVPGAVQLDWARAEGWPPYWHGENASAYAWMEDVHWIYRAIMPAVALAAHECLRFACGGVDYRCELRVNGTVRHAQEGMFTPFAVDLTAHASSGAELEIVVFPVPKAPGEPRDRRQARASVKPAVSYGWDFHPRLIPLGIWEESELEVRPSTHLADAELRYVLDADQSQARLTLSVTLSALAPGSRIHWTLRGPSDETVANDAFAPEGLTSTREALLEKPQLWWPHDHGAQPLYHSRVELLDGTGAVVDVQTQRVGLRRVRLVLPAAAGQEPPGFPKSRRPAPMTLEVNGRAIFAKGSNWVSPDIFPGPITGETYRPLVTLAQEAHLNLLRAWGGAPVPKESFFDLCDQVGLLVWQEFPLACNPYPDDAAYLRVLDQESRSIIRRLRRHPCLALWSGGNELFNSWSGMDDQALPLRLLNRNCYDLDPETPFIPTSPLEGVGHGDYRFRDENGQEVFTLFTRSACVAYPEFGCPGPAPVHRLQSFIPADELWPPRPGGAWSMHHGFDAWVLEPTGWLALSTQRHYFGEPADLNELVTRGQWLQSEACKCLFEEARRQKPRCGMALNWCFNEPWPAAANNSIVHWPCDPKPALAGVAAACRPALASARVPQFSWRGGELFSVDLWLLNDQPEAAAGVVVTATIHLGGRSYDVARWDTGVIAALRNVPGPRVACELPCCAGAGEFSLRVAVAGRSGWDSEYRLHYRAAD